MEAGDEKRGRKGPGTCCLRRNSEKKSRAISCTSYLPSSVPRLGTPRLSKGLRPTQARLGVVGYLDALVGVLEAESHLRDLPSHLRTPHATDARQVTTTRPAVLQPHARPTTINSELHQQSSQKSTTAPRP
eukprot:2076286-Rhodomonas_salina.1